MLLRLKWNWYLNNVRKKNFVETGTTEMIPNTEISLIFCWLFTCWRGAVRRREWRPAGGPSRLCDLWWARDGVTTTHAICRSVRRRPRNNAISYDLRRCGVRPQTANRVCVCVCVCVRARARNAVPPPPLSWTQCVAVIFQSWDTVSEREPYIAVHRDRRVAAW